METKLQKHVWAPILLVTLVQVFWAIPVIGVAHRYDRGLQLDNQQIAAGISTPLVGLSRSVGRLPQVASFRIVRDRGLLIEVWINGSGPYKLAIDTGAGGTIISERLATAVRIPVHSGRRVSLSGLSGRGQLSGYEAVVKTLALGNADNLLPENHRVILSGGLPPDIDGILDPTEAYFPFGYIVDIPNREITAFDCTLNPLSIRMPPSNGAVVPWITEGNSRRPFVRLDDGRLALVDTGSAFGLAVTQIQVGAEHEGRRVQDLGGGTVTSRRAEPSTVSIGALTLRKVPTDVLSGVEQGAPTLLGRAALSPFRLAFDPLHRLIAIAPAAR